MRLIVPALDAAPWPTLGPEVCDWIEERLCHGPGDILGEPITLTDEERLLLYRAYEVYPRAHRLEGRRRFNRVAYSRRKGARKTELAAWVAIAEMDPEAPVRCDGWRTFRGEWVPVGRPIRDPYIPMVAITEEQVEDLAYGAAYEILTRCTLADEYDVGLERIVHKRAPGKMQPLAGAPGSRDGARTSFQHFDETHGFVSPRLRGAHATMLRNIAKRIAADAWSFETTTMYGPGEGSVAEDTHRYAEAVERGEFKDPRLYFDHRQARDSADISTDRGLRAAIREASGDAWAWTNVEAIVSEFRAPNNDENASRRFWLNQRRRLSARMYDPAHWAKLAKRRNVADGTEIVLGFDGSYRRDTTALVACTVEAVPYIFVVQAWERPLKANAKWRTPRREVEAVVDAAMERYDVRELSCDPPGWGREIEDWEARYGDVVVRLDTNQPSRMGPVVDDFEQGFRDSDFRHDGNEALARHIANCSPARRGRWTLIDKPPEDDERKIDIALAAHLAYHRARWHYAHDSEDGGPGFFDLGDFARKDDGSS